MRGDLLPEGFIVPQCLRFDSAHNLLGTSHQFIQLLIGTDI